LAWSSLGLGFSGSDSQNQHIWNFYVTGNPGEVLILCIAKNTAKSISGFPSEPEVVSVTDEGNNSWTKVSEYVSAYGSGSGTTVAVFFTKATNSPGTVYVTFSDSVSARAAEVRRFSTAGPVGVQDYVWSAVYGQPGAMALDVPTGEYLWLRAIASRIPNTETWYHTPGYTGFNRAGTYSPPQSIGGEFIIATGSSQTSNPTTSGDARRASLFIAFKETAATKSSSDGSTLSGAENLQLSRNLADSGTLTSVESATTEKRFTVTDAGTLSAGEDLQLGRSLNDAGTIAAVEEQQSTRLISQYDSGALSSLEDKSLEVQRVVNEADAGTLVGAEQLTLARDPADVGTLLSDEAIVFERAQADAGTVSVAESLDVQHAIDDTDVGTLLSSEAEDIVSERVQADAGTISALENQSLEVQRVVNEADAGTLVGAEQLTLARDPADVGTLLSDEAEVIAFEQVQADVGTVSTIESLTVARALGDVGILAAEETATRSALIFVNAADTGLLAGTEAQGISKLALKAPPALRVTNYLRRTV